MQPVLTDPSLHVHGWQSIAAFIDHTILKPDTTRDQIVRLCEEAAYFNFAAVCVSPWWIGLAASQLAGTRVKVASVIGFPHGVNHTTVKRFET